MERLVAVREYFDSLNFDHHLVVIMGNIEDGLLEAGAKPGKDYTYMDLCQAAMPIVREAMQRNEAELTYSWGPND